MKIFFAGSNLIYKLFVFFFCSLILWSFSSCNSYKFLTHDELLLSSVSIKTKDNNISVGDYDKFIRQRPNSKWFNFIKAPLAIYSLSSADTTRRKGRFFRRMGEKPVVFDSIEAKNTLKELRLALIEQGYLHANVDLVTKVNKRSIALYYLLSPYQRYYVSDIQLICEDQEIDSIINQNQQESFIYKGMPLDMDLLSKERDRVVDLLQTVGYYKIQRDFFSFRVDTIPHSTSSKLYFIVQSPDSINSIDAYEKYSINKINLFEEETLYNSILPKKRFIRKNVYSKHVDLKSGELYNAQNIKNTYASLNALPPINYTTIHINPNDTDSKLLNVDVHLYPKKIKSIGLEVEGTNTNGDLGTALILSYTNRNLFRGAELFSIKLRGAYEAISKLEGYNKNNYLEYSVETNLQFPATKLPLFSHFNPKLLVRTGLGLMYNSQNRPEFHRRLLTANWGVIWNPIEQKGLMHQLDILSFNYVFMPWISNTFKKNYLQGGDIRHSILRESYQNLFIMRTAYSFLYISKKRSRSFVPLETLERHSQIKFNFETAGNVLRGFSALFHAKRNDQNQYELFNIAFSQYTKFYFDGAYYLPIDYRNSIVFHGDFGIAIPYGNSSIVPYEKRFFSGGANSLRGWSVRSLGPGAYIPRDGNVDFIKQTGNIKLDLNVEWRTHLFWKFDGAAFIDAGNIWNIRNYKGSEAGTFYFSKFYRQIAVSYGLGLRFNLSYFILRLDVGMKAINPVYTNAKEHFPLLHPKFSRDMAWHFAVGLPF